MRIQVDSMGSTQPAFYIYQTKMNNNDLKVEDLEDDLLHPEDLTHGVAVGRQVQQLGGEEFQVTKVSRVRQSFKYLTCSKLKVLSNSSLVR